MAKAKILKFDAAGPGLSKTEILKVCEAENVRFMRLQFTDIFGVIKNVELPSSQFSKALDGEIQFDGSSIEGFTRIEESDMRSRAPRGGGLRQVVPFQGLTGPPGRWVWPLPLERESTEGVLRWNRAAGP